MILLAHAGFSDPGGLDGWSLLLSPFGLAFIVCAGCIISVIAYFSFCFMREVTSWFIQRRRDSLARAAPHRGFEIRGRQRFYKSKPREVIVNLLAHAGFSDPSTTSDKVWLFLIIFWMPITFVIVFGLLFAGACLRLMMYHQQAKRRAASRGQATHPLAAAEIQTQIEEDFTD